jgi:excisionase family DNA binding protein
MRKIENGIFLGDAGPLTEAEVFLTRQEAAAYLRCSVPTMERWARLGTGPKFRLIGRRALYALPDLRDFAKVDI